MNEIDKMEAKSLRHFLFLYQRIIICANPNSDFDNFWKDLLECNNINLICTLIYLFSNETILVQRKKVSGTK